MKLSDDSLTPLYQQVIDDIRAKIDSGEYAVGTKIPSESELSELYSVSRITIRHAIEELAASGFLTKKQGKGTYVNAPKLEKKVLQHKALQSFTDVCIQAGREPGAKNIRFEHVKARAHEAEQLEVPEGTELLVTHRVRTIDGVPMTYETCLFPLPEFAFLEQVDLSNASLYELIAEGGCRTPLRMASALVEVVSASREMASLLSVHAGEPLFRERGIIVDANDKPVFLGWLDIVGSMYAIRI